MWPNAKHLHTHVKCFADFCHLLITFANCLGPDHVLVENFLGTLNLRGRCFQKLLLVCKFSCISKNGHFLSSYIVVWTIYTSHTDLFTPQNTVFEYSAACLSFLFELRTTYNQLKYIWKYFGLNVCISSIIYNFWCLNIYKRKLEKIYLSTNFFIH